MNDQWMPVLTRTQQAIFDPCSGKGCYSTLKLVRTVINERQRRNRRETTLRHYYCVACGGYHITSKPLR